MKVDKFDYKRYKDIVVDIIWKLMGTDRIYAGSFNNGFYFKSLKDANEQLKIITDTLKNFGVDLFDFIKKFEKEVFSDHSFTQSCAMMDYILYTYDKNKAELSGFKLKHSDLNEYYYKYSYGYYKYDMGKKYLMQSYDNLDDYFKDTAHKIIPSMLYDHRIDESKLKDTFVVKKHKNGYIAYCNLELLKNIFKGDFNLFIEDIESMEKMSKNSYLIINDNLLRIFINCEKEKISKSEHDEIIDELDIKYKANMYNL